MTTDRTSSVAANQATFRLTNMVPQASNNNGGPWEKLETYTRSFATSGRQVFVVAGGTFYGSADTIGDGVWVPDETWKVVVPKRFWFGPSIWYCVVS